MYPLSSNVQRPAAMKYLVEETEKSQSPSLYVLRRDNKQSLFSLFLQKGEQIPQARFLFRRDGSLSLGMRENMAYTRGVTDNMRYSLQRVRTIQALVPEEDEEGRLSYYLDIMKCSCSENGNRRLSRSLPYNYTSAVLPEILRKARQ